MSDDPRHEAFQPRRVIAVLRRRAWLLIPCIVLGTAVAYLVSHRQEKRYSATAAVLFQQAQLSQQLFGFGAATYQDPTTQSATNITLVSQPIIAVNTAHALGLRPAAVSGAVSVAAAGASNVVNVTASDHSPTFAATLANTYVQEFLNYRQGSARAQIVQAVMQLQGQIAHLRSVSAANGQLPDLETRLSQLQTLASIQTGDVQLAEPALVPTSPSSPRPKRAVALGFIAGLIVGLLAVFVAEKIDRTLRDAEDAKNLVGLPLLGMIPSSRDLSRAAAKRPLGATVAAETFRLLRTQLRYFNVDREVNSVLITSAAPGDGKSTVAWNLARTAASLAPDSSVLIVDCDLRRPSIADMAAMAPAPGLAEILTQDLRLDETVRAFDVDSPPSGRSAKLHVLTSGAPAPNPTELMESQKLRRLVEEIHSTYNFVIFDAPPTAIVPDAIPLMAQVSGVLVVLRLRHTRRDAARRLHEQLARLGAPSLGLVLNDVPSEATSYKGYAGYASYAPAVSTSTPEPVIDVGAIQ